jgi:hypothetical protein
LNYADFYALMPSDNPATVAPGAAIEFPEAGPTNHVILSTNTSTFQLTNTGTYLILFQASVAEAGQLMLTLDGSPVAASTVGRATGTSQIVGMSLLTTSTPMSMLKVINPAGNSTALTMTPIAGGTVAVSAHLVILQIQ